jgi:hypothetical protein
MAYVKDDGKERELTRKKRINQHEQTAFYNKQKKVRKEFTGYGYVSAVIQVSGTE